MQKLYYSISEAAELIDEEQHILRYWEKEFEELNPRKNRGGNRIYSQRDIKVLRTIKMLLRGEKLSIYGAKEKLPEALESKSHKTEPEDMLKKADTINTDKNLDGQKADIYKEQLKNIRLDLIELKRMLTGA